MKTKLHRTEPGLATCVPAEDRYVCTNCGGPPRHPNFCCGLCESEWYEFMEAASEAWGRELNPAWIEFFAAQYESEHAAEVARQRLQQAEVAS